MRLTHPSYRCLKTALMQPVHKHLPTHSETGSTPAALEHLLLALQELQRDMHGSESRAATHDRRAGRQRRSQSQSTTSGVLDLLDTSSLGHTAGLPSRSDSPNGSSSRGRGRTSTFLRSAGEASIASIPSLSALPGLSIYPSPAATDEGERTIRKDLRILSPSNSSSAASDIDSHEHRPE